MDHVEKLAEASVKEAIESLVAKGERAYSGSVPMEAERLLRMKGRGRVSEAIAVAKVKDAIWRLKERKEIKAPVARYTDWVIVDRSPQSDAGSQST